MSANNRLKKLQSQISDEVNLLIDFNQDPARAYSLLHFLDKIHDLKQENAILKKQVKDLQLENLILKDNWSL